MSLTAWGFRCALIEATFSLLTVSVGIAESVDYHKATHGLTRMVILGSTARSVSTPCATAIGSASLSS